MKLDRNIKSRGKYALVKLREVQDEETEEALLLLHEKGVLDWGYALTPQEFFVIRLKDVYAFPALVTYASAAAYADPEWAHEIMDLASRSGPMSQWCKRPD